MTQLTQLTESTGLYRYVAGYDSGPGSWPTVSVVFASADGKSSKTVWMSDPLDKYQFDRFTTYVHESMNARYVQHVSLMTSITRSSNQTQNIMSRPKPCSACGEHFGGI